MLDQSNPHTHSNTNQTQPTLAELFSEEYSASTLRLLMAWFAASFIYYGLAVLLPSILDKTFKHYGLSSNLKHVFLIGVASVEVLSHCLSSLVIDHPSIGRKRAVSYSLSVVFLASFGIVVVGLKSMVVLFLMFAILKYTACTAMTVWLILCRLCTPTLPKSLPRWCGGWR